MQEESNVRKIVPDAEGENTGMSRRQFVTGVGGIGIGAILGGLVAGFFVAGAKDVYAVPVSGGYLLVDTKKCCGCTSCMLACSLTHHGHTNLNLARVQVEVDPYGKFPLDTTVRQCRQCPFPACVEVCPTGANHVDTEHGNVRTVDKSKCIGCERCVNACPFQTARVLWNYEEKHAQKCDLCTDTPFWEHEEGVRACQSVCPEAAITFTTQTPVQAGTEGYDVDLRTGTAWDPRFNGAYGSTGTPGSGSIKK